jgi:hypothetical protein
MSLSDWLPVLLLANCASYAHRLYKLEGEHWDQTFRWLWLLLMVLHAGGLVGRLLA